MLVEYVMRGYYLGYLLTILYFNDCANKFLRMKGVSDTVGVYWHNSFFKRHPEIQSKFSRPIDRRRMNAEDSDKFIDWFRRFNNIRFKWGIIDSDIYNINKSGCVIGAE